MTNSERFFEAFIHVPHHVLGRRLKPLSLLHLLFLYHIESPLVLTDRQATLPDLELAVLICSSSTSDEILSKIKRNGKIRLSVWRNINAFRKLKKHLQGFIKYTDDYCSLPRFNEISQETEEVIPWILMHAASLIKNTGWDKQKVFELPVGESVWFNTTFSYLDTGKSNVQSDKEAAVVEFIKALTEKG